MREAAVLLVLEHGDWVPVHWHTPDFSAGAIPDSRDFWEVIWSYRNAEALGIAHSHPGVGYPSPSSEDVTTFAAVEAGLGRRLFWWILSYDHVVLCIHAGPGQHAYRTHLTPDTGSPWMDRLREISNYGGE